MSTCGCLLLVRQTSASLISVKKVRYRILLAPINTANITKVTYFHKQSHWSDNKYILLARRTKHSTPDGVASGTIWASESPRRSLQQTDRRRSGIKPPTSWSQDDQRTSKAAAVSKTERASVFFFLEGANAATPQADGGWQFPIFNCHGSRRLAAWGGGW